MLGMLARVAFQLMGERVAHSYPQVSLTSTVMLVGGSDWQAGRAVTSGTACCCSWHIVLANSVVSDVARQLLLCPVL
jgi:hypothetical protein